MLCYLDAADVLSRVENTIKNQVKKNNIPHTIKVEKAMVFFFTMSVLSVDHTNSSGKKGG